MSSRVNYDDAFDDFLSDTGNWQLIPHFPSDDEVVPSDQEISVDVAPAVAEMLARPFSDQDWAEIDASLADPDENTAAVAAAVPAHVDIHPNNQIQLAAPVAAAPPPALGDVGGAPVGVERPALNVAVAPELPPQVPPPALGDGSGAPVGVERPARAVAVAPALQQPPQPQARPIMIVADSGVAAGAGGGGNDIQPRENDVLPGRGGLGNHHAGNNRYRDHARSLRAAYRASDLANKKKIVQSVIRWVEQENRGRFLVREKNGAWALMANSRKREKVGQYLRENS